jgi:hypothetical protein
MIRRLMLEEFYLDARHLSLTAGWLQGTNVKANTDEWWSALRRFVLMVSKAMRSARAPALRIRDSFGFP